MKSILSDDCIIKNIPNSKINMETKMNIDLIKDNVTPAEGEHSVRTYYCTYYQSKLLGLEAKGFLGVTNKRVIFQANGTSNAGNSVIQSELPISDVSGISSYKGTYFSLGHLLGAFLLTAIASGIVTSIVTTQAMLKVINERC